MKILEEEIKKEQLKDSKNIFDGPFVKGVVDVEQGLLGIDAEMHADIEKLFLENGSRQDSLWGINLWFEDDGDDFLEYDSMINIRPRLGNNTRDVDNPETRQKIKEIVEKWIK